MPRISNTYFKCVFLNVRSINTGFIHLKDFIINNDVDVFGLTETWLKKDIPSENFHIPNYQFLRCDREIRGGGLAFYVKRIYSFEVIYSHFDDHTEQLWLNIKSVGQNFVVGVVYRPPQGNIFQFLNSIEDSLSNFLPVFDSLIVGGDFNVNLLDATPGSTKLIDMIESYNLTQLINVPTRITENSETLLDLFITTSDLRIIKVDAQDINGISDHLATVGVFNLKSIKTPPKFITRRSFKEFNEEEFRRDIFEQNWDFIYTLDNVDDMLYFFNNTLLRVFDLNAPVRTFRVTKPPAPWLTYNIKQMIKLRDRAHNKYKKTRTHINWKSYTELRNYVTGAIRREQKAYMEFILRKKDSKSTWNTLRSLGVTKKDTKNKLPDFFENLNDINEHFSYRRPPVRSERDLEILNKYNINPIENEFHFKTVDIYSVSKCLSKIRSNATGADGISIRMIQYSEVYLLKYITYIFNFIITSSTFPTIWKNANVIPLPKSCDPKEFNDLRPISILPTLSKAFEKLLKIQIDEFISIHQILPEHQSGFRANYSTTTALLKISSDVFNSVDKGYLTCLILLDFTKAFDTLDPIVLCKKLKYFGFSQHAVQLIETYLQERKQQVVFDGDSSEPLRVTIGVPQGSILGPILFSLYISDFHEFITSCSVHHYADDTQLYISFRPEDILGANETINKDLQTIMEVSSAHNLRLNPSKSSAILFGSRSKILRVNNSLNLRLGDSEVPIVSEAKNLGLWIDSSLRFSKHVSYLCQVSFNLLRQLYPSRSILPTKLKLTICESLIFSKLSYCDVVYGPALTKFDETRLQRIQNACVRFAYGIRKYDHISKAFTATGWPCLVDLRKKHLLCLVHKILTTRKPEYLFKFFKYFGSRHTRNDKILVIPRHSTSLFKRSFPYIGSKLYNLVPLRFKDYSIINFKKKIKENLPI